MKKSSQKESLWKRVECLKDVMTSTDLCPSGIHGMIVFGIRTSVMRPSFEKIYIKIILKLTMKWYIAPLKLIAQRLLLKISISFGDKFFEHKNLIFD